MHTTPFKGGSPQVSSDNLFKEMIGPSVLSKQLAHQKTAGHPFSLSRQQLNLVLQSLASWAEEHTYFPVCRSIFLAQERIPQRRLSC